MLDLSSKCSMNSIHKCNTEAPRNLVEKSEVPEMGI
jgi:hypothetical protein